MLYRRFSCGAWGTLVTRAQLGGRPGSAQLGPGGGPARLGWAGLGGRPGSAQLGSGVSLGRRWCWAGARWHLEEKSPGFQDIQDCFNC